MPWIQYNLADGSITGWNSSKVSDDELSKLGKMQLNYDGDPSGMMVAINQDPHVVIQAPAPPTPPADMITHIFNAMIQQGWIDPAKVDPALIERANVSLAVNGAKTIA